MDGLFDSRGSKIQLSNSYLVSVLHQSEYREQYDQSDYTGDRKSCPYSTTKRVYGSRHTF